MTSFYSYSESDRVPQSGIEKKIEIAFGKTFRITWKRERRLKNTIISVFLLKPSRDISQTFGFEREIALFWSNYDTIQPRSMQAIDQICAEDPLIGRIDQSVIFLASPASNLNAFVSIYCSENPETRMVVPFDDNTLERSISDDWAVKNNIRKNLFIRNLFDYRLPLRSDAYFYGREDIVASIHDNIRKSQNTGVFGLRKTGKTSVLLKVKRLLQKSDDAQPLFLDCKKRSIRSGGADNLAKEIIKAAASISGKKYSSLLSSGKDVFDVLSVAVQDLPKRKKLCVIFDEIEYISPISPLDDWKRDFIDLWQSLWTIQSEFQKICYVVCGVNPTVCDVDRFESPIQPGRTVQNPMFSIFNVQYLRGFSLENLRNMIGFFGKRMGLHFTDSAIEYLHDHYGGHPLLTRLACSYYHETLLSAGVDRPVRLDADELRKSEKERDGELASYCGHVVSEIKELYPNEYYMLEMLARNEWADFHELSSEDEFVRHIREYGLVSVQAGGMPRFLIPVVREFLRKDLMGVRASEKLIEPPDRRRQWISMRTTKIASDIASLDQALKENAPVNFFGGNGPKRIHTLCQVPLADDENSAVAFLVKAYKLLVESADKNLRKGLLKNEKIACVAPNTTEVLNEIRTYRNYFSHDDIKGTLLEEFERKLRENFLGKMPQDIEDGWYMLQKHILDKLHVAIQCDLAKY